MMIIGTVDELNSHLGVALSQMQVTAYQPLRDELIPIQQTLFELGAVLSGYNMLPEDFASTKGSLHLESLMDSHEPFLIALKHFILPGGTPAAAHLHVARAVCRRLESMMVKYNLDKRSDSMDPPISSEIMRTINRLSDYLFTIARRSNQLEERDDVIWISE